MLKGFEEETAPLNEQELRLVPMFVKGLETKLGAKRAITNKAMAAGFAKWGITISSSRVRKIINHIRTNNLVSNLVSTSKGYYIAQTKEEVDNYLQSLSKRIDAQQAVLNALRKQSQISFGI